MDIFIEILSLSIVTASPIEEYYNHRKHLLQMEASMSTGGHIHLSDDEIKVNEILMALKNEEDNSTFYHPNNFNFNKHYFEYKYYIDESKVYQIIKKMPKGAALHTHETFALDAEGLVKLTYEDNLFICYEDDSLKFSFAERTPDSDCPNEWILLSQLRFKHGDAAAFDEKLKQYFSIVSQIDNQADINEMWRRFDRTRQPTKTLLSYRPVREKFLYEVMQRFYDDNVMYVEMRTSLYKLYELNGTQHETDYTITLHREVTKKFIKDHPDFVGIKLIISTGRKKGKEIVQQIFETAKEVKRNHPDMIAGFDLVGQEERGYPLTEYVPMFLESKGDIDYYFHAGETHWFGTATDENILDAILLGSKRIGHGLALGKHPLLLNIIKEKDIAVEVNVISNAVLDLVGDIREHPLALFISRNVPVVLSSDDPGVWGAEPLSHDFYVSYMAVANRRSDLRLLKQLALNSIKYSALDIEGKKKLRQVFDKRWNEFLRGIIGDQRNIKITLDFKLNI